MTERNGTLQADHAFLGTGYSNQTMDIVRFLESNGRTPTLQKVLRKTEISPTKETSVAVAPLIKEGNPSNPQGELSRVYFVAPGAGKLAEDSELVGIIQNSVSLFNNAPRTDSAVATLVQATPASNFKKVVPPTDRKLSSSPGNQFLVTDVGDFRNVGQATVSYLESVLKAALDKVDVGMMIEEGSGEGLTITITEYDAAPATLFVSSNLNVRMETLIELLASTRDFFPAAKSLLESGDEEYFELVFTVKPNSLGTELKVVGSKIQSSTRVRFSSRMTEVKNKSLPLDSIEVGE